MISLVLMILYTCAFTWWLVKISGGLKYQLSPRQVTLSFLTKVAFGITYGFLFLKFYNGDDTWQYHNLSLIEYEKLLHQPLRFFTDLRNEAGGHTNLGSLFDTKHSFYNEVDEALFIKLLAVFNLFSFGHYYVNVVIFCFVVYLGNLLLYRQFIQYFPNSSQLLVISIFYLPMTTFWLSGLRKEGILFLAISIMLFFFDRIMRREKNLTINIIWVIAGFAITALLRNAIAMCIAPCLFAWFLCTRFHWNMMITFAAVHLAGVFLFFGIGTIPGLPDLAEKVTQRQYGFFSLTANTRLPLDSLHGTPQSFLQVLPQAINHSFLRPYFWESKGMLQIISAADVFLFLAASFASIFFLRKDWRSVFQSPVICTCLFISLSSYLLIGYTVPFPGAFVRYKAIFELLFFCILSVLADLNRLKRLRIIKN